MSAPPHRHLTTRQAQALAAVSARAQGAALPDHARVTVHFHPDLSLGAATASEEAPVLSALRRDGRYRSQFETGTSNGGLSAFRGGDRWRWESRIFGGAYDDGPPEERPVYGALDVDGDPFGAAPRFGSAFLRLRTHTLARTTFCFPDSVFDPTAFGTADRMALLAAFRTTDLDRLDAYVEAQVHGPVHLDVDVEALVLDPSHQGTAVETIARTLPCRLTFHPGYRLTAGDFASLAGYRGAEVAQLGRTLAGEAGLTPASLGAAWRDGVHDPQLLKKVWHCLARFGANTHGVPRS